MESPQADDVTASADALLEAVRRPADLGSRVVYFPLRHHSPACAVHVDRLIRETRPDAVLIEGPRDATDLIPLLLHPDTRYPVAIYTTYTEAPRGKAGEAEGPMADSAEQRHAAYYPLCDYSPELAAIRAAAAVGARTRLIDLTYPEMVRAGRRQSAGARTLSLQDERHLNHGRFLEAACRRTGARDPQDLWDHLFEVDGAKQDTAAFVGGVLAYCHFARAAAPQEELEADGTLVREAAMAAAVKKERGRVVVVTGGLHSVALPHTKPAMPARVRVRPQDALVVLTRYGFEQLDRLNGYASGMASPGFYQRIWEGQSAARIFVDLGRRCREKGYAVSVADEIAGLDQCRRLAQFRGHGSPSREDVLDGVRSSLVKGASDADGLMVLALARQLLAGDRVGSVPEEAGQPPILSDFRRTAKELRVDLDKVRSTSTALDLYRRPRHRAISRFFHRMQFLEVPFAELQRGPDFVTGEELERIQELWDYRWAPDVESVLIERGMYGPTLEEAAAARLVERFSENEKHGLGRRADVAVTLVLEACRMGLHRHTPRLMGRTAELIAEDGSFPSLVRAIEGLLVLHVSREPLEAHRLSGVLDLAAYGYERACYLLAGLAGTGEGGEAEVLAAMVDLIQSVQTLGDTPPRRSLRAASLHTLVSSTQGSATIRGAAAGLLYGDGELEAAELARLFRGHLHGAAGSEGGASFLRGLLHTARSAIWQVEQIVVDLHAMLRNVDEGQFVRQLPLLRLALADLTPRETDHLAGVVARHAGLSGFEVASSQTLDSGDVALALQVQRAVEAALGRDGLPTWAGEAGAP